MTMGLNQLKALTDELAEKQREAGLALDRLRVELAAQLRDTSTATFSPAFRLGFEAANPNEGLQDTLNKVWEKLSQQPTAAAPQAPSAKPRKVAKKRSRR